MELLRRLSPDAIAVCGKEHALGMCARDQPAADSDRVEGLDAVGCRSNGADGERLQEVPDPLEVGLLEFSPNGIGHVEGHAEHVLRHGSLRP